MLLVDWLLLWAELPTYPSMLLSFCRVAKVVVVVVRLAGIRTIIHGGLVLVTVGFVVVMMMVMAMAMDSDGW